MTTAPLIRTLELLPGETPTSYVARLAAHHRTIPREFCSDFGMRWPFLCSGQEGQLQRLSRLTGADLRGLQFWSPTRLKNGRYRVGGAVSSVGAFRRTTIRVCPICMRDALQKHGPSGAFQLLEWCVTCLHRCDTHGVALCALPPGANSHETYDVVTQVMRHDKLLAAAAADPVPLQDSPFETNIRLRIRHGPQDDWLKSLELVHLHRACMTLGLTISGHEEKRLIEVDRDSERRACDVGFAVLAQGPPGLEQAFDRLRHQSRDARAYFSADLGHFHAWLRTVQGVPALDCLTSVVRRHVFRHYPAKPDRPVLGMLPDAIAQITFDEARSRAKLGVSFLKRLLAHIDGVEPSEVAARTSITPTDLDRVTAFWATLCNLTEAAEALGIRPEQVKALIHAEVLSHLRFGSALRYPCRAEIDALLQAVDALPRSRPWSGDLPLTTFCAHRSISLARVIAAWRSGVIDGQVAQGEGSGLQALRIAPNALCDRDAQRLNHDPGLADAARYLRISLTAIRCLRDAGLLQQIRKRNADTNFQRSCITRTSIRAFERDYITLGQIAERNGIAPMHLARRLDHDGVPALETRQGLVRVYLRDLLPNDLLRGTKPDAGKSRSSPPTRVVVGQHWT